MGGSAANLRLPRGTGAAGDRRPLWVRPVDCRQALPELAAQSVSLILTDPPYFLDGMGEDWSHRRLQSSRRKAGVVGGLPVGMKFDSAQGRRLQAFLEPIAGEWLRVLKPGGFVLCFSQSRLVHRCAVALENAGFEIRDLLAWHYEGQAKAFAQEHFVRRRRDLSGEQKRRIIDQLEGRKTPQLKPQMENIVLAQAPRDGTFVDNWLEHRTGLIDTSDPLIDPQRFPGTVIRSAKPRQRYGHLTAKPVELLRHLIRIFSAPGAETLILDPFAGSGSTGVAARTEGRGFLGFEIDPEMAETADRRVVDCLDSEPT